MRSSVVDVIKEIINLNPDVVMWCSLEACVVPTLADFLPLPIMEELDYLPKAFSYLDCIDNFDGTLDASKSIQHAFI